MVKQVIRRCQRSPSIWSPTTEPTTRGATKRGLLPQQTKSVPKRTSQWWQPTAIPRATATTQTAYTWVTNRVDWMTLSSTERACNLERCRRAPPFATSGEEISKTPPPASQLKACSTKELRTSLMKWSRAAAMRSRTRRTQMTPRTKTRSQAAEVERPKQFTKTQSRQ